MAGKGWVFYPSSAPKAGAIEGYVSRPPDKGPALDTVAYVEFMSREDLDLALRAPAMNAALMEIAEKATETPDGLPLRDIAVAALRDA